MTDAVGPIAAGTLRRRVVLQRLQRVPDGVGGYTENWINVATVWGGREFKTGRELYYAQQIDARFNVEITIRWRRDVTPQMRIVWGQHTYLIHIVSDVEDRQRKMVLSCEEIAVTTGEGSF